MHPHGQPPARSCPALTLDGAEAPALVLAVVLGGGTPQVAVLSASAGAAVEPLVVILEGDGAGLPVGVPLDGVDLCKEGSQALASRPWRHPPPITQGARLGRGLQSGEGQWHQRVAVRLPLPSDHPRSLGEVLLLTPQGWAGVLQCP